MCPLQAYNRRGARALAFSATAKHQTRGPFIAFQQTKVYRVLNYFYIFYIRWDTCGLVGPTGKKRCQFLLNGGGWAFRF
jgi:hypothetical protein